MNSANGGKPRDLESELVYHPSIPSIHEKQSLKAVDDKKSAKMSKIQHCIFTLLLFFLLAVGIVAVTLNDRLPPRPGAFQEKQRFEELLNTVDPSALHEVLHENMKDKYQHGVFEKDKAAVEAIHQQNAEVAESLIELAKRQATGSGNGTVVTSTAVTTTDTVVTSTESITSTPSSVSTTPVQSQSSTVAPTSQRSTSTPESSTPSSTPESTVTKVSTSSASTTTSVPASRSESTPVSTSPTPTSQASTSSSEPESGSGTNTSPMTSRTTVYTTTLANGAATTVTSVTIVPAGQADQTTGGTSPSKTGSGGSLQTGGSAKVEFELSALLGMVGMVVVAL